MGKSRLEAFSDGVIAIIITIMVLELRAPHGASLDSLRPLVPVFLSYALSFLYVGIYCYVAAIVVAPFSSWLSLALYVGVALLWLIPDRRIELVLQARESEGLNRK
jgi:uncharacterized membrane protein